MSPAAFMPAIRRSWHGPSRPRKPRGSRPERILDFPISGASAAAHWRSRGEIERLVAYQIGAANALAAYAGARLAYVKIHGALSNIAAEDETIALAIARAVKMVEPRLGLLAPAGTKLETAGLAHGLAVAREIYADRAYTDAGLLVERSCAGAVLHDPGDAAARVLTMVLEGAIITISGKRGSGIDSICLDGDSPMVAMAKAVRTRLRKPGSLSRLSQRLERLRHCRQSRYLRRRVGARGRIGATIDKD